MKIGNLKYVLTAVLGSIVLGSCGGGEGPPAGANASAVLQKNVEFVTLALGDSEIEPAEPVHLVIRNASDWVTIWSAHTNQTATPAPLPMVDFNREMVVGIVKYVPDPCHSLEIKKITRGNSSLLVEYTVRRKAPADVLCMGVIVVGSHFVAVPESQLPVQFVLGIEDQPI